jgi:hypothetical protein
MIKKVAPEANKSSAAPNTKRVFIDLGDRAGLKTSLPR